MIAIDFVSFWEKELAGRIVRRSGDNWLCRSPFREDRHPSFSVNASTGVFNDFADENLRGDAIDFLKMRYSMTFPQAREYIGGQSMADRRIPSITKRKAPLIKQGIRGTYTLREIVIGGISNRGAIAECFVVPDYINTFQAVDCYHSIYLHTPEIRSYQKSNNGKLAGYCGAVWCDTLYFDIDFKGGTLQGNISKAQAETKRLIQHLKSNGVSSFQIKFSGSKGFHISIEHPALSAFSGYKKTPIYAERFARKLSAGFACDYSIYRSAIHLIRSVNSINSKSGLYAIPLSEGELYTLSTDEILLLAKKPRPQPKEFKPVRFHSHLLNESGTIYADSVTFDNGTVFSKLEIDLLKTEKDKQAIKSIFTIKSHFGGNVTRERK